jgi:hypothetical protein
MFISKHPRLSLFGIFVGHLNGPGKLPLIGLPPRGRVQE